MKKALFCLAVLLLSSALGAQQNVSAPQKFALVIGNGAYTNVTPLGSQPVNDANDMEAALKGLGFTVDKVLNGTQDQMVNGIMRLKNRLSAAKGSYGFLFYAGHGVQSNGENYLIPVDANIPGENFLRNRTVSVQEMLDEMNDAGNELNVVVLDACRDNPFSWRRSGSRGLTVVTNQPADSIIVYATSAGSTAADGTGRNGLFTGHLLQQLKTPGLDIKEVFDLTGAAVSQASGRQQIPAIYSQYFGKAYLGTRPTNTMVRIPGGTFMMGSPASEPQRGSDETQHRVTVSSFSMGKYPVTQKEYQEVMGTNPSNFKGDNLPVEKVSWYDAIVYCNRRSMREGLSPAYRISGSTDPSNWGTVPTSDNAAWNAVQIVAGSDGYRLPAEAEWEYACRTGTATPFSTGNNITTDQANYDGNYPYNNNAKGEYRQRTTPVGSFAPNAWGLYDMHGNVWEWCWDWYGSYSNGAQTDPTGAVSGSYRVLRGGSWDYDGQNLRSAYRDNNIPNNRSSNYGFRLCRP